MTSAELSLKVKRSSLSLKWRECIYRVGCFETGQARAWCVQLMRFFFKVFNVGERISVPSLSGLSWVVSLALGPVFEGLREVQGRYRNLNHDVFWEMTRVIKPSQTLTSILDTQLSSVAHQRTNLSLLHPFWFTEADNNASWISCIYSTFQTCQKLEAGVGVCLNQTDGQLPGWQASPRWGFDVGSCNVFQSWHLFLNFSSCCCNL